MAEWLKLWAMDVDNSALLSSMPIWHNEPEADRFLQNTLALSFQDSAIGHCDACVTESQKKYPLRAILLDLPV